MKFAAVLSFLLALFCAILPPARAEDVSAPALLQYFESRYETIEERAPDIFKCGYGLIYTPPPGRADQGSFSVGYDQYDRFDLGKPNNFTLYGSETGLKQLVKIMHSASLDYYIDYVINHNGYSDLSAHDNNGTFYEAGGYPGMCITLPEAIDGDFHSGFNYGDINGRLAGLIDIDHATNFRFYRNPVPGLVAGANDGGNIRAGTKFVFGRIANVPDINNTRFYPDKSLPPISIYDPHTGEGNIKVYPYNLANPLNGTPVAENVTGYLMRNAQWLVQTVGIDGFRLDAAKHVQGFALDYFDRAVYRTSFRSTLDGQQKDIFSFCEVFDGNKSYLQTFVVKNINHSNPGVIGGNRDTLDFPLFFALHDNLTSNGLTNSWYNIQNATLDTNDDGFHNGSSGVMFAASHDNFGADLSNIAHAYVLLHPGNAIVYFNAHEFGDANARSFPKDGRGDALGGLFGNAIPGLVDIRNRYGRGNFIERWIEKENYAYERSNSCLVMLSNRVDAGYDSRTLLTNFSPGTRLVELTGNAASATANPFHDVPELVTVNNDHTVNVRFLRNTAPGTNNFTGNGYLIYGPAAPQGSLSLTNIASTLAGGTPTSATNGTTRINDIKVITADSFQIKLTTNAVNLLGSLRERDADGDNALVRIDEGIDLNGNGHVDYTTPGNAAYGFEEFATLHSPGYFNTDGNGAYAQTVDATKLSEGLHFITVRCFRHRADNGPAIFADFRQTIYVDRKKPVAAIDSFNPLVAGVNQNRQLLVRSTDLTANNVHTLLDLPFALTDAQVIAMVGANTQAGKIDRDLFAYGFNNLTNGNHVVTTVTYERTGNVSVQRFAGNNISTLNGAGLGDTNFDGQYTPADIDIFRTLLASQNAQFNPAADMNGDGKIDSQDLTLLGTQLNTVHAGVATLNAYDQLVNDLSPFNNPPTANPVSVTFAEGAGPFVIPTATLLAGATPGPGAEHVQTLTLSLAGQTSTKGYSLVSGANGITYQAPANFNGTDSFVYKVTDNGVSNGAPDFKSATATVTITVAEVNSPPIQTSASAALLTPEDNALTVDQSLLTAAFAPGPANESAQTLSVQSVTAASQKGGTVSLSLQNGKITYTPPPLFNGSDTIFYVVVDNGTTAGQPDPKTAQAAINVTVTPVNNPPIANPDAVNAVEDTPLVIPFAALIANDSYGDPENTAQNSPPLVVTAVSPASTAGGTVRLSGSTVIYTPPTNFNGTDTFTYTITDSGLTAGIPDPKSASGVVTVSVSEVNDPPITTGDAIAASVNTPSSFTASLLALNDMPGPANESSQTLTVTAVSPASTQGGTVELNASTITYTPAAGFMGTDTFTYTVTDDGKTAGTSDPKSATGTVTVTVSDPNGNQPPVANTDIVKTAENTPKTILALALLVNDTRGPESEDTQSLTITAVSPTSTQGGTVTLGAGKVIYTPPAQFYGSDSFTYTITDNGVPPLSATGTVLVTVSEVNDPPVAMPDALQTDEDVPLAIPAALLLNNDSPGPANESGQTLTLTAVSPASAHGGTVALNNATVIYTPPANFNGIDTFTYIVGDNGTTNGQPDSKSASGTVTVTVLEVNDPPVPTPDSFTTAQNTQLKIVTATLSANDSPGPANESTQTLSVTIDPVTITAKGGTVYSTGGNSFYAPPTNFVGEDSFTYTVKDNGTTHGVPDPKTATGVVTITVTPVNQAPTATADTVTTAEDVPLAIAAATLLANDSPGPASDNGQTLTLTAVSASSTQGGTVVLTGTTVSYTPPLHYFGADSFTYQITDNGTTNGAPDPKTASGTVQVTVTTVNQPPVASPDTLSTRQDTPLSLASSVLLANDTPGPANENAQSLTLTAVSPASAQGGTVALSSGNILYTPPTNFTGTDQFTYTVVDNGTSGSTPDPKSATGLVTVTVIAVNQTPVAFADTLAVNENEPFSFPAATLTANDIPGPPSESAQTVTLTGVTAASSSGGTVTLAGATVTYTPPLGFTGTDTFGYSITDDGQTAGAPDPKSSTGTVNVTVSPKKHAPIISALTALPGTALVSEPVVFSVIATDADADPLLYTWTFSDGQNASGSTVSHAFALPGTFNATVTVADGTGMSDSRAKSVTINAPGLTADKLAIQLKLKPGSPPGDSITLSGSLPVPNTFNFAGSTIQFNIGGVMKALAMDAHGKGASSTKDATLSVAKPKSGISKFTLSLKKGNFAATLASAGLANENSAGKTVQIPVTVQFNGHTLQVTKSLQYKSKMNVSGAAK